MCIRLRNGVNIMSERNRTKYFRKYNHERYSRLRYLLLHIIGNKCADCGKIGPVEIHHIFHDGERERERMGSGLMYLKYYTSRPALAKERLKPLCHECHLGYD